MDDPTRLRLLDLVEQMRATLTAGGRPAPGPAPTPAPTAAPARPITSVTIENTGGAQTNVPVTFGHVFAPGDLPAGKGLARAQLDVKATHPDGSVRHAVVSLIRPELAPGEKVLFDLVPSDTKVPEGTPKRFVSAEVVVRIDGVRYTAASAGDSRAWLAGPCVTELQRAAELCTEDGNPHPHLAVRFATRCYAGERTRVDVTVENAWAYEPNPQNFVYDVEIYVGGALVFERKGVMHYHHARWRHVAWAGPAPQVHVRHDTAYLIASRAVPNYDQSVVVPEEALARLGASWAKAPRAPMQTGFADSYMPRTGGRPDIGLLPSWAATYVLSMDARAKEATLGTADLAGSFSVHYRDKGTGQPVSLQDYPYMTVLGRAGDTLNPKTGQREAFPAAASKDATATPLTADSSHQPSFAYLPYLVTGDYYYLEELQFWAMWNVFSTNPGYRGAGIGVIQRTQVRGQAWSLRTLAHAAYLTPDNDRLKAEFVNLVENNLAWYNGAYVERADANKLGVVETYGPIYRDDTAVGPWQDDFFTAAVGHVAELGFRSAEPLLRWKARFPVGRMVGEGVCWLAAASYNYVVRPSALAPYFTTMREAYAATVGPAIAALPCGDQVAAALGNKPGDMGGYPSVPTGYPSNMQPALAYAADALGTDAQKAWALFTSRSIKPDYGMGPQFAIVPRGRQTSPTVVA